ncbi:hypothetical protein K1719_009472 [Acacia pycnantha]|nr:hypothetical protein K1719_009472 [Acacia pycnantha]
MFPLQSPLHPLMNLDPMVPVKKGSAQKKHAKKKSLVGDKIAEQESRQEPRSVKRTREINQKVAAAKEVLCLTYDSLQPGEAQLGTSTRENLNVVNQADQDKMEQEVFMEASQDMDSLGLVQGLPVLGVRGLVGVWRSDQVHVVVVELDRQFIHLECSFEGGPPFLFTSIYSIPDQRHKQILWEAMEGYASVNLNPWVVMGDFNDIALNGEKSGGSGGNEMRMRRFTERLRRCRLSDLGACGPRYTWKGPISVGGRRIFERLDRALDFSG